VLLVAGELDAKFTVAGERMAAAIGANARAVTLPGCGHAAHLERPAEFCRLVWTGLDPSAAHPATENRSSSSGSGATRRTGSQPSTGTSGSATTSKARSNALPRPQA